MGVGINNHGYKSSLAIVILNRFYSTAIIAVKPTRQEWRSVLLIDSGTRQNQATREPWRSDGGIFFRGFSQA
jgi:hypothetical protein